MTTFSTPPPGTKAPPEDPYPNKAVTTLVTTAIQWAASGSIQFTQEVITLLGGALATVLVWFVSNWKRKGA